MLSNYSKYLKLVVLVSVGLIATPLMARNFMTTPPKVTFDFNRNYVRTIHVVNKDTKTLRLEISKRFYMAGDEKGPYKADKMLSDKANDYNLVPYMRLSTKRVSIPSGKSRVIKLMVKKPQHKLSPGTYKGYIYFKTIPPKLRKSGVAAKGVGVQINLIFNQNSSVTGTVGKGYPDGATFKCVKKDGAVSLQIKNPTPWEVATKFNIVSNDNKVITKGATIFPVLPYTEGVRKLNLAQDATVDDVSKVTWVQNQKDYSVNCQ